MMREASNVFAVYLPGDRDRVHTELCHRRLRPQSHAPLPASSSSRDSMKMGNRCVDYKYRCRYFVCHDLLSSPCLFGGTA